MSGNKFDRELIHRKAEEFESAPLVDILRWCWEEYGERAAIGTSFQGAGLVVMHTAWANGFRFPVFTIDTGLLFPETLELKAAIESRLGIQIEALIPEQTVDQQAAEYGPELWKTNPDLCCSLRKVIPLQKKLSELDVWITGLRRQQSETRDATKIVELYHFDVLRDRYIVKLNPMAAWTREDVQAYIREHDLPVNALTAKGYRSIGCRPCTRPTAEGESERAGRWTGFDKSECGIHTFLGNNI
ncbi:MAG: phosphoadenylyl-sulfate reductase [Terrimicrobiaceae bacterium]|nr:phosphoadenylyl-sulfate reductase [Terrimicrobiaceae bacterium]